MFKTGASALKGDVLTYYSTKCFHNLQENIENEPGGRPCIPQCLQLYFEQGILAIDFLGSLQRCVRRRNSTAEEEEADPGREGPSDWARGRRGLLKSRRHVHSIIYIVNIKEYM